MEAERKLPPYFRIVFRRQPFPLAFAQRVNLPLERDCFFIAPLRHLKAAAWADFKNLRPCSADRAGRGVFLARSFRFFPLKNKILRDRLRFCHLVVHVRERIRLLLARPLECESQEGGNVAFFNPELCHKPRDFGDEFRVKDEMTAEKFFQSIRYDSFCFF